MILLGERFVVELPGLGGALQDSETWEMKLRTLKLRILDSVLSLFAGDLRHLVSVGDQLVARRLGVVGAGIVRRLTTTTRMKPAHHIHLRAMGG